MLPVASPAAAAPAARTAAVAGDRAAWRAPVALTFGVVSGALAGVGFRYGAASPLLFIALVPLLVAARSGLRAAALAGGLTGVIGYAIVFAWLPEPLTRFQGIAILHARLFFAAAVIYHAAQLALLAVGVATIAAPPRRRHAAPPAALVVLGTAALSVVLEWGYPKVFPWSFGGALAPNRLLRQAADLGGEYGLGFAIIVVNAALAAALDGRSSARIRRAALAVAAGVVGVLLGYGYWRTALDGDDRTPGRQAVAVGIVQGAIPVGQESGENAALEAWETYQRLTRVLLAGAAARPGLIVWPETTLQIFLREQPWFRAQLEQLVNGIDRPLVLGALDRSNGGTGEMNAAYAVLPGRTGLRPAPAELTERPDRLQVYHKSYLVPWAEYVPAASLLPALREWRTTGDFVAGTSRDAFVLEPRPDGSQPLRIAPSICVEGLQGGWFNPLVRAGASVLLNITDDGWLAGSAGPELHLQLTRMRAVETRRWLVRASNSGISAVIDPDGEIVASLPFGEAGTLTHAVVPSEHLTPYVRFGDWVVWASGAIVVVVAGARRFR